MFIEILFHAVLLFFDKIAASLQSSLSILLIKPQALQANLFKLTLLP
jgi:hypothetical protein